MGIEPTNKGFAGHCLKCCNPMILKKITMRDFFVGPTMGPSVSQIGECLE